MSEVKEMRLANIVAGMYGLNAEIESSIRNACIEAAGAARDAERERCAKVAEHASGGAWGSPMAACYGVAERIRIDPAKGE